jgi:hypothetical protein
MQYNHDKVDEVALALLYLTLGEPLGDSNRAWKGVAWEVSNRLYEKGWIEDPRNKNESLVLTKAGREACIRLFKQYFWEPTASSNEHNAPANLFPLPIDMERLIWLYQLPENEPTFWLRYLDSATGEIMAEQYDEESGAIQPTADLSSDPRYLSIPAQSDAEYLDDIREYTAFLQQGELKTALTNLLEGQEFTPAVRIEIRSLLRNHDRWEKWQRKRIRQRLLVWLASYGIKPKQG